MYTLRNSHFIQYVNIKVYQSVTAWIQKGNNNIYGAVFENKLRNKLKGILLKTVLTIIWQK